MTQFLCFRSLFLLCERLSCVIHFVCLFSNWKTMNENNCQILNCFFFWSVFRVDRGTPFWPTSKIKWNSSAVKLVRLHRSIHSTFGFLCWQLKGGKRFSFSLFCASFRTANISRAHEAFSQSARSVPYVALVNRAVCHCTPFFVFDAIKFAVYSRMKEKKTRFHRRRRCHRRVASILFCQRRKSETVKRQNRNGIFVCLFFYYYFC